jgi:hypothetical protein
MPALVVPGVRVEARFDILPPLPAPSGIVGAVGIVDRPPASGLISVTKVSEMADLLGTGTEVSMPQVVHALGNGASEVVISAVVGGASASATLLNVNSKPAVRLRCRSHGAWGNSLYADVRGIYGADGKKLMRVTLRLLLNGSVVEEFDGLRILSGAVDDLFETVNATSRYVVALDPGLDGITLAGFAAQPFDSDGLISVNSAGASGTTVMKLYAAPGASTTDMTVKLDVAADGSATMSVYQHGLQETFTGLTTDPDAATYLPYVLQKQSRLVRARIVNSLNVDEVLPRPTDAPVQFTSGSSPNTAAYATAIDLLSDDPRIDLVMASIEPGRADAEVSTIHQALQAHAVSMADNGAPRIAFGSISTGEQTAAYSNDLSLVREHAAMVRNRRFVLVAPSGAEGAVVGLVGRLDPQDSPTFKSVPLFGMNPAKLRESQLNDLLGPTMNLCVVQDRAGHGVVVLRGLDTTGDQISVTRVADECIRETKAIAENFIGELNTDQARGALKQQIVATFTRMQRDGALVPSTDGSDPAFVVDVYSTQLDFAQGIVRVDIAVRPVRAIDYIYATIRVKN